MQSPTENLVIL